MNLPTGTPRIVADGPLADAVVELLGDQVEILPWSLAQADGQIDVDGMYTFGHPVVTAEMLDRMPALRVISNYGVGVDHIDLRAAADRGIPVGNTPGILNGATADMGFCLLLAAARRLVEGDRYARGPDFTKYDPAYLLGREVHGTTLGILGLGRIGEQVARRASGFDMRVLYHNRSPRTEAESKLGASYVSFDQLLSESDFLMVCAPLTAETRGRIGAAELRAMKSTAVLINIARGPIVDTDALTSALKSGQICAAGLDVTDPEPLPRDHPLLQLANVIVAPHLGSATVQTRHKMAEVSVANLLAGLRGEQLLHQVGEA